MRRALLLTLAVILCVPPVRFVVLRATARDVDRTTPRWHAREEVLSRGRVFVDTPPVVATFDFTRLPGEVQPIDVDGIISCRYVPKPTSGTTSKFDCRLDNGEIVKVKYGHSRERQGEGCEHDEDGRPRGPPTVDLCGRAGQGRVPLCTHSMALS